ncbi:tyrosine-type recombinase/integrase [Phenylobacterium koreense]|uniref:Integrase n=1 Tax=Phenylobacterium koreense TaxID=266125 RepID=A0ABV2EJK1_9CAUL
MSKASLPTSPPATLACLDRPIWWKGARQAPGQATAITEGCRSPLELNLKNREVANLTWLEVGFIVRLAALTGLRRADLLRLEWAHISDVAIQLTPLKTSRRRQPRRVIVPLLDETLALLKEIKEQQERRWTELAGAAMHKGTSAPPKPHTVLSNTRGRAWTKDGAEHQVLETKQKLGIDKHLHDCRGSFATRLRKAGATASEIADILGWTEARVERLLALYVDTDDVVRDFAERIRAKSAARRQS